MAGHHVWQPEEGEEELSAWEEAMRSTLAHNDCASVEERGEFLTKSVMHGERTVMSRARRCEVEYIPEGPYRRSMVMIPYTCEEVGQDLWHDRHEAVTQMVLRAPTLKAILELAPTEACSANVLLVEDVMIEYDFVRETDEQYG